MPNTGETVLVAAAGDLRDESRLRKVEVFNEAYRLKEKGAVLNWFDITMPEGYLSLNDKISTILETEDGAKLFKNIFAQAVPKSGDGTVQAAGFEVGDGMMQMLGGFTFIRLTGMLGAMNINFTKEQLLDINAKLNCIPKP